MRNLTPSEVNSVVGGFVKLCTLSTERKMSKSVQIHWWPKHYCKQMTHNIVSTRMGVKLLILTWHLQVRRTLSTYFEVCFRPCPVKIPSWHKWTHHIIPTLHNRFHFSTTAKEVKKPFHKLAIKTIICYRIIDQAQSPNLPVEMTFTPPSV